ncbi:M3 family oligoendopeptidase [Intestinimonas butyriciproducens]|uniref:M3 family oligoendopeptidase n=1 Tax=Intestinimonas butyriciproducens TaxID=1297617 RepID=UPI00189F4021|nr:M3 family oligoendopeptidase [Intestinimonas butyriciproducens]
MEANEGRWDLSALYNGFDDPAFEADIARLDGMMEAYRQQVRSLDGLDAAALADLLGREEAMWVVGADLQKFTDMRREADAGDSQAVSAMGRLKKLFGSVAGEAALVRRWMGGLVLTEADYAAHPILADYRFFIGEEAEKGRHMLDTSAEELLGRMQGCAGGAWTDLRGYLTSFAHAPMNGKEYTLTQLRGFIHSPDKALRKAAFEAELACSKSIEGGMAFALNGVKEHMNLMAELRGYGDVMTMTMAQCRMQSETLKALWGAVEDALPKFHAYLCRKARVLGYEKGLPWYELCAGLGESGQRFDTEGARAYLVELLGAFAPDLGEMVDRAFREHWIDFYPRPGKSGGAFCRNLSNQKQSRVLTNFEGNLDGVVTIAHELGHAYHGHLIQDHRPLNRTYTMPVAETASNFNETLVMNAAIARARGQEKLALLEQRLQDYTQVICDIYSRFLFEREVFEERKGGFLFPERLCQIMAETQKTAYGPGLDPACLHPYMWVNKVHYYYTTLSFYNFPYAFGALLATGLYARYQKEGAPFVEKYRTFLRSTTVSTVEEAAAVAGIDVTQKAFWAESLAMVAGQIDEFLLMTEDA